MSESHPNASDQESVAATQVDGEFDITTLHIYRYLKTSFSLEIQGRYSEGSKTSWISSLEVNLYHENTLVAEGTIGNILMEPYLDGDVEIQAFQNSNMVDMDITNMMEFERFIVGLVPTYSSNDEPDRQTSTTAHLKYSSDGHHLTMSIDLEKIPRFKYAVAGLKLIKPQPDISKLEITPVDRSRPKGPQFEMTLVINCDSPLVIFFEGQSLFSLVQDETIIGQLESNNFELSGGGHICVLRGSFSEANYRRKEISGMAFVKGCEFCTGDREEYSWLDYVIKEIEFAVNLDDVVVIG